MIEVLEKAKFAAEDIKNGFAGTSANDIRVFDQNLEEGLAFVFPASVVPVYPTNVNGRTTYYCLVPVYKKDETGKWQPVMENDAEGNPHPSVRRWFPGTLQRALQAIKVDENDTEKFLGNLDRVRAGGEVVADLQKCADVDAFIEMAFNKCGGANPTHVIVPSYPAEKRIWTRNLNYGVVPGAPKHRQQSVCDFNYEAL